MTRRAPDAAARRDARASAAAASGAAPQLAAEGEAAGVGAAGLRRGFLDHGGELFGFALRALRDRARAEDAVQETFARAWRSRRRFDQRLGPLRGWLFAIERRVLLDMAVAAARTSAEPLPEEVVALEEHWLDDALRRWQVTEALSRLDEPHRRVVTELYLQGRTSREVAERAEIPEGTVRSRAFYALRALRAHLESLGWER